MECLRGVSSSVEPEFLQYLAPRWAAFPLLVQVAPLLLLASVVGDEDGLYSVVSFSNGVAVFLLRWRRILFVYVWLHPRMLTHPSFRSNRKSVSTSSQKYLCTFKQVQAEGEQKEIDIGITIQKHLNFPPIFGPLKFYFIDRTLCRTISCTDK